MREMLKMVIVLAVLSAFSGGLLASLRNGTKERIENQELELVKGPAIRSILTGCLNDPISDRIKIADGKNEKSVFIGLFDNSIKAVAFETIGSGFADKFGIIVAVNIDSNNILGVRITTHKETPGLGANAKDNPKFVSQFKDLKVDGSEILLTKDGGEINALSGATVTSRAVCAAVTDASKKYIELKPQFSKEIKEVF